MIPDLIIAHATLAGHATPMDVAVAQGRIVGIATSIASEAPRHDAGGRLLTRGLVECHIHLDKAGILHRTTIEQGTLGEAVSETARLKAAFTTEDVYARAAAIVEQAISHGTMAMRTFVEVDPRAGLRSFEAIKAIRGDYADAIDIQICAFAQEGLTNEPQTEELLAAALADGADLVGGCSYTDPDPAEHIRRVFALADRFGVAADFHVDFDLTPTGSALPLIIAETRRRRWQGYVACGHATKLSTWPRAQLDQIADELAENRIGIVALPATDLFLLGRDSETLIPRGIAPLLRLSQQGVVTAIATNNALNPFTPYGDANLMRMANMFANVSHFARDAELDLAFAMIGRLPATLLGRPLELEVGSPADLVLFDATSPVDAVRRGAPARVGWKAGRETFSRPPAILHRR
jgi:cytosine deaminase